MAYEKIGFNTGDILKAEHMNHIEEGISANSIIITPQMCGALCDGKNDDAPAIQAALELGDVYCPPATYTIKTPITIYQRKKRLICDGELNISYLSSDSAAIVITGNNNDIYIKTIYSNNNQNHTAIKITGYYRNSGTIEAAASYYNKIEVGSISGVTNGIWFNPNKVGIAYTTFIFKEITAERGIYFRPVSNEPTQADINAGATGAFICENTFIGGCISGSYPIVTEKGNSSDTPFDGNKFYNIAMEFVTQKCILNNFSFNHLNGLRLAKWENSNSIFFDLGEESFGNFFNWIGLLYINQISDKSTYLGNNYKGYLRFAHDILNDETDYDLGREGYSYSGSLIIPAHYSLYDLSQLSLSDITQDANGTRIWDNNFPYAVDNHTFYCNENVGYTQLVLPKSYGYGGAKTFNISLTEGFNGTILVSRFEGLDASNKPIYSYMGEISTLGHYRFEANQLGGFFMTSRTQ